VIRNPKRKADSRPYKNYDENKLEEALTKIADSEISILADSKLYKISYETSHNRYNEKHVNRPGTPIVFTDQDEMVFLTVAMKCGQ
jgi:hypothetical protein